MARATRPDLFSVVIPTMQRAELLGELLRTYDAHPAVAEIIVVNNTSTPLEVDLPKLRVLDQGRNIFVNPAWNLGARESRADYLLISNDDIAVRPTLLDGLARLVRPRMGLVGPRRTAFGEGERGRLSLVPAYRRTYGYGTLMCLPRSEYHVIPDDLQVFYGDDYLFDRQRYRSYYLRGAHIATPMSVSSREPWAQEMLVREGDVYEEKYAGRGGYQQRFAREQAVVDRAWAIYHRSRGALARDGRQG